MATKNFFVHDGLKVRGNTLLNGASYSDTPLSKLHVKSAANGVSANLTNVNGLIIENSGSSNTNYALKLATGAGNILSVTNAGRMGIGTTTPNVSGLTVVGDISASGNIYGDIADLEFTDLTVTGDLSVTGDSYFAALSSSSIYNTGDIVTVGDVEADEFIGSLRGAVTFKAQAGEAISKGDVVYISGISGNTTVVSKADADDANKMPAFGIAQEAASLNTPVTIVNFGSITNINTSSFPEGTELFVGTTAGALVSAAPTGETSAIQKIAKVTRQDNSAGSMTVMGAGRSNAVPNLNEGRLFVGNSSNQAVADGTIHVDIANSRVGIGTTVPDRALHVKPTSDVPAIKVGYDGTQGNGSLIEFDNGYTQKFYVGMSDTYSSRDFVIAEVSLGSSTDATNPKYVFNGNGDGAFYITDAADNDTRILLNTNGDSYLSGGYVGIGITNPSCNLHVRGCSIYLHNNIDTNNTCIHVHNTSNGNAGIKMQNTDGSWQIIANDRLRFYDDDSSLERLSITSSGRVGIGATDPRSKLFIAGGGIMLDYGNGGSTDGAALRINSNSNEAFLQSNAYYSTALKHARSGASSKIGFRLDATRGGDITFTTAPSAAADANMSQTEVMTIKQSGNVGIGTTDPGFPLEVSGAIGIDDYIYHNGDNNTYLQFNSDAILLRTGGQDRLKISNTETVINDDTLGHDFRVEGDTDTALFITDASTDRVGIGTTNPVGKFHIKHTCNSTAISGVNPALVFNIQNSSIGADTYYGNIRWGRPNSNGGTPSLGIIARTDDSNPANIAHLAFYTEEGTTGTLTERMVIENGGNVGIGITAPEAPLHILGGFDANNPKSLVISGREHASAVYSGVQFERAGGGTFFGIGNDSRTDRDEIVIGGGFGSVTNASSIKMYTGELGCTIGTARMTITSAGDVEIPGSTTICGAATFHGSLDLQDNDKLLLGTDDDLEIYHDGSNSYISDVGTGDLIIKGGNDILFQDAVGNTLANMNQSNSVELYFGGLKKLETTSAGVCITDDIQIAGNLIVHGTCTTLNTTVTATSAMCIHNAGTGPALQLNQTGTQPIVDLQDDGTSVFYIEDGGNVGIGTTNPGATLDVRGDIRLDSGGSTDRTIYFRNQSSSTTVGGAIKSDQYLSLWAGNGSGTPTQYFTIKPGGNVGIGTISPNAKLEISGDTRSGGRILYGGTESNYLTGVSYASIYGTADTFESVSGLFGSLVLQSRSNTDRPIIFVTGATPSEKMRLTAAGKVGIGTTDPEHKLQISSTQAGGIQFTYDSTNNYRNQILNYWNSSTDSRMDFNVGYTSGSTPTNVMSVGYGARVGIGTTNPNEKLTVSGNISASGIVFADAFCSNSGSSNTIDFNDNLDVDGCLVTSEDAYINSVRVGRGNGCISTNTVVGCNALNSNTTGVRNTAVGSFALNNSTTGGNNVASGYSALRLNETGCNITAVGYLALCTNTASANTAVGGESFLANTTGVCNVGVGYKAGRFNTTGSGNTASGYYALKLNTTGSENTATGASALRDNTTGVRNTAHGRNALLSNTIGNDNVAFGRASLYSNTSGSSNTAIGKDAIYSNTSGVQNTSVGLRSLYSNTTGSYNTASGYYALRNNVTGTDNTALGYRALRFNTASSNTAVGASAMFTNTTGTFNTAVGKHALYANTSGNCNTAIGYYSLSENTTGFYNTASGYEALCANTTGAYNAAFGAGALDANTTGIHNLGLGGASLSTNTIGSCNTAVGYGSQQFGTTASNNTSLGFRAMRYNTTGSENVIIGSLALYCNTTGSCNTAVGFCNLHYNTIGRRNTASGNYAMKLNTTGSFNSGFGYATLFSNTTGNHNTASGYKALFFNTTASANSAFGTYSLYQNTTGVNNTASGMYSLRNNTTGSSNTAMGRNSLLNNTTGALNVAVGVASLQNNTTGIHNTASGTYSLYKNTTGNYNSAHGLGALQNNTTGSNNVASGMYAMYANTTGADNAAFGTAALQNNTTGNYNTAVGRLSQFGNTVGCSNTSLGYSSLRCTTSGTDNTAVGTSSLYCNTTGSRNTAYGYGSMKLSTTSYNNTASGVYSLKNATTGIRNTALGYHALRETTIGCENTAVGLGAMLFNTTGNWNTAVGTFSLYCNTVGQRNAAVGRNSLRNNTTGNFNSSFGYQALYGNTTGSNNSASGYAALLCNTTGSNNTASGYDSLRNNTGSSNTAIGYTALRSNTTGDYNTALGRSALYNNTGANNTSSGAYALYNNTTAGYNSAFGASTLRSNTTGSGLAAFGASALYSNTTGNNNTAVGNQALQNNTSGGSNTAVGNAALLNNTTGASNVSIGLRSLYSNTTGSNNTASGYQSLHYSSTSSNNTASGYRSLYYNTTGANNTASGFKSLFCNTTGSCNAAFGQAALFSNTTGNRNTAVGTCTLYANTTASFNAAFGSLALKCNTTGSVNSGFGTNALFCNTTGGENVAFGTSSLYANTTGNCNTAYGRRALSGNTTGSCNVAVGWQAACANTTQANTITIGYNAVSCGNNTTVIGNSSTTNTYLCGTVHATCFTESSSLRYKCNIQDYSFDLDCIDRVRPVSYVTCSNSLSAVGYIAEEMNELYPEVVVKDDDNKPESINYARMVVILIEKVKDLQNQINILKESLA